MVKAAILLVGALVGFILGAARDASAARTIYASADGKGGYLNGVFYDGSEARPLDLVLRDIRGELSESVTVQLLTKDKEPTEPTVYRLQTRPCSFVIDGVEGSERALLMIKGVHTGDRWLTQITGPAISEIIDKTFSCGPVVEDVSLEISENLSVSAHQPALEIEQVAFHKLKVTKLLGDMGVVGDTNILSPGLQMNLVRCFRIQTSKGIVFEDLAFKDCWLPALFVVDSQNITLRNSLILGSSYVFFAKSTKEVERAKHYTIERNIWIQDATGYGLQAPPECQRITAEADCPGEMWSKIPWGVTHDTLYEHMNGALFGSIDVAGDVDFHDNVVRNAYNGIRMVVSDACFEASSCRARVNRNVRIYRNRFVYLRDNPVEPEKVANNWKIFENEFKNSHAWISLDAVANGPIYIFANIGWYDDVPDRPKTCDDSPSMIRRQRIDFIRGGYYWLDPNEETENLSCPTSRFGTVIKVGDEEQDLPKDIYVFHNSWMIRIPLVRGGRTGTIHHWNNAMLIVGCGVAGDDLCRIEPSREHEHCHDYFTADETSLILRCVDPVMAENINSYDFRFDLSSKGFPASFKGENATGNGGQPSDPGFSNPIAGDFHLKSGSPAIGLGCIVKLGRQPGELVCEAPKPNEPTADIGAFDANGQRYAAPPLP